MQFCYFSVCFNSYLAALEKLKVQMEHNVRNFRDLLITGELLLKSPCWNVPAGKSSLFAKHADFTSFLFLEIRHLVPQNVNSYSFK